MRLVVGNKINEIDKSALQEITSKFDRVEVDLGTGDGRFVYQNALKNPNTLFIGIDPAEKQLEIYSKKALRKKLGNALFVVGSFEIIPEELKGVTNKVYIILPWGTLLENLVKPTYESIKKLSDLLQKDGEIEITFGYAPELEPHETKRLNLPEINKTLIEKDIIPRFEKYGYHLKAFSTLEKSQLSRVETTWAKRLKYSGDRNIFKLVFSTQS